MVWWVDEWIIIGYLGGRMHGRWMDGQMGEWIWMGERMHGYLCINGEMITIGHKI